MPQIAYAGIAEDINSWMCSVLRDTCNWIFSAQATVLGSIGVDGVLSMPFESMLGTAGEITLYDMAYGVWQTAVLPIACGVLSFVFTVQLIHISQHMEAHSCLSAVREVIFLLIFFAVFLFIIQNSFELMRAIYEVIRLAITRTTALFGSGGSMNLEKVSIVTGDNDVAALLAMIVVALLRWIVVVIAYITALVVTWARAIQLYLMVALSPIPLSLMALDETRQIGVGYLRQFAAVCLAGLIITVLLIAFPVVLGGLNAVHANTSTVLDSLVGGLSYALQYLAMCVLLIFALTKSGAWAREVLGG